MWLVGNNKDLKHVYKPHLDGHTQYGLEGHGYGEGLTSLTGIPVEEKSPRLRGMAADRRVQAFEHRHNDTDVTNPWGKKEWEFCEPRARRRRARDGQRRDVGLRRLRPARRLL